MKKVVMYTTPTCVYCRATKEFFKEHNVAYEEYDVASNMDKRNEMMDKSGQLGVPVITVDNDVIIGYDPEALSKSLGL